jgi:hypothetical protein
MLYCALITLLLVTLGSALLPRAATVDLIISGCGALVFSCYLVYDIVSPPQPPCFANACIAGAGRPPPAGKGAPAGAVCGGAVRGSPLVFGRRSPAAAAAPGCVLTPARLPRFHPCPRPNRFVPAAAAGFRRPRYEHFGGRAAAGCDQHLRGHQ